MENEYNKCSNKEKKFFKFKKYINKIFPKKEDIYSMYPKCKKYHYPSILCWVYRWICILLISEKRANAKKILKQLKDINLK
jgi:hypothetical protein